MRHANLSGQANLQRVKVMVEGHPSNLHHVWDTEILENAVGISEQAAEASLEQITKKATTEANQ
jgi:hypothetical protein